MSFKKSWNRFELVSKASVPRLLLMKWRRSYYAWRARRLPSPIFALVSRNQNVSLPKRTTLFLHPDVFLNDFPERFRSLFPQEEEELIKRADDAVDLTFDLLGSGPVHTQDFKERTDLKTISGSQLDDFKPEIVQGLIPWHFDLKSGVGWDPRIPFSMVRYGHLPHVDVKVPWELSRCGHFLTLGQAYLLTREEVYAQAFVDHILDWITHNPCPFGINWKSAMEVSLRASNWLLALEFFQRSAALTEEVRQFIFGSLLEHGRFVWSNLEWNADVSTNHYLSDLLGLYHMGLVLHQEDWSHFAWKEWKSVLLQQTYSDGFNHEASSTYHRFVSEVALLFGLLETRTNRSSDGFTGLKQRLGDDFGQRFYAMFETLHRLSSSDGRMPLIGDNDSGRVHALSTYSDDNIGPLLVSGTVFLNAPELLSEQLRTPSDVVWLFGFEPVSVLDSPIEEKRSPVKPPETLASGLVSLKGERDHLVFSAQPNGTRGLGNHTHNDKLSWTLFVEGDDFFVDPGVWLYTSDPAARNLFRSTRVHNTVMVDGQEQNEFVAEDLFALKNQARVTMESYQSEGYIRAHHTGYTRLSDPVLHRRILQRHASILMWDMEDHLEGSHVHDLLWNFTLGPMIKVDSIKGSEIYLRGKVGEIKMSVDPATLAFKIQDASFAPSYGVVQKTKAIVLNYRGQLPFHARFVFHWKGYAE